ncbi:MAG: TetR/AcrR family transcriptional regulator [Pseudomonadota bacterium]
MDSRRQCPKGRKGYHHGDLKRSLIDGARAMIEERGDWSFSMRELAARIGVSPMAAYSHFADKQALLAAVAAEGFDELSSKTRAAADAEADPQRGMFELGLAYITFGVDNPARYRLMFGATFAVDPPAELRAACDGAYSSLTDQIEKRYPHSRSTQAERDVHALSAWSTVHGYTMLMIDRPSHRLDRHVASRTDILNMAEALLAEGKGGLQLTDDHRARPDADDTGS